MCITDHGGAGLGIELHLFATDEVVMPTNEIGALRGHRYGENTVIDIDGFDFCERHFLARIQADPLGNVLDDQPFP